MFSNRITGRPLWQALSMAALLAASLSLLGTAATAGECPVDKRGVNLTKPGTLPAKDVTDTVIGMIDVAKEPAKIDGRQFRLRRLEVKAGGVVPWHSHGDRPAIIYIVSGQITEYASSCAVPIVHKAGEVAIETSGTSHWWKNNSTQTVVLLSADLLHDDKDHNM